MIKFIREKSNLVEKNILGTVRGKYENGLIKPLKKVSFDDAEIMIVFIDKTKFSLKGNGAHILKALQRAQKTLSQEFANFDLKSVRKKINSDFKKRLSVSTFS